MRTLIFASLLGSAMSAEQIEDRYFDGECHTDYPLPGGLVPEDPGNIESYFSDHPILLSGQEDTSESLFLDPPQAMVVPNDPDDAAVAYRAQIDAVRNKFKYFIGQFTTFAAQTGIYSEHANIVKEYTDYMRQLAAYGDAVAAGDVKSAKQLSSIDFNCANQPPDPNYPVEITFNQVVFDQWKLDPFDTAPVVGVNAGDCSALENAYRGSCGCESE